MRWCSSIILMIVSFALYGQTFYYGNDLSYVNQMEDCGGVFKENGEPKDVYQIFADRGTNLVRLRLWVDPAWQNSLVQPAGVNDQYSDYIDVKEAIQRSKEAGMQVLLDFHLSDLWADPGRQLIPDRWLAVASNIDALKDSVYNYILATLTDLNKDTLMPEIVQIGNETNDGILKHSTMDANWNAGGSVSSSWSRHAQVYNAGIQAVRDISDTTTIKPKIALHCAGLSSASWWFQNIISNGVTDFDIMGLSYYYAWHESSIGGLGNKISELRSAHPGYDVMVLETGYLWTTENFDDMANIITTPDPRYLPVIPEKQLEYMTDLTRTVKRAEGIGVIFWEPAWISTPCRTPWGQGSSHDHVVYFDPDSTNFMENGGGRWMESPYYEDLTTRKVIFNVDMTGQDVSKGVYITGSWTGEDWVILPMANVGNNIYSYYTYLHPDETGGFYFLNDTIFEARESLPNECAEWNGTDRQYTVGPTGMTISCIWQQCTDPEFLPENKLSGNERIFISPNPSDGKVKIQFYSINSHKKLQVFDMKGALKVEMNTRFESEKTIDLSNLKPGFYYIRVNDNQNCVYAKLIRI